MADCHHGRPLSVCAVCAPALERAYAASRILTAGEEKSLEKVALLRGELGRVRASIRKARNLLLDHEHTSPKPNYPVEVLELLREALGE